MEIFYKYFLILKYGIIYKRRIFIFVMKMKKFFLIYNKDSGSDNMSSVLTDIIPTYQKNGIIVTSFCLNVGERNDFLPFLKNDGYSGILISGGDGTVRSVISFLLKHDINLPIGLIPAGTCNDLANSLGIPKNNKEAALIPLNNEIITIDIGVVNKKSFFFSSCAGGYFMPDNTDYSLNFFKKVIKKFAYYVKTALRFNRFKPFDLNISIDGDLYKFKAMMFGIATGSQIAGFDNILKQAKLNDGFLDIFIIDNCSHLQANRIIIDIIRGKFIEHKHVHYFRGTSVYIDGLNTLPVVFDGEEGDKLPLSVSISKARVKVFV